MLILNPSIANRDCQDCLVHQYDEKTGLRVLGDDDKPVKRLIGCGDEFLAPCRDLRVADGNKRLRICPKGTPEEPNSLSEDNEACFDHYKECEAVGFWPDDPLVRRNAAVIRDIEKEADERRQEDLQLQWMQAMAGR